MYWIRTYGAPRDGDPRDGELHQVTTLTDSFYLEPWDGDLDGQDARYVKDGHQPEIDGDGRRVWRYVYQASPHWNRPNPAE